MHTCAGDSFELSVLNTTYCISCIPYAGNAKCKAWETNICAKDEDDMSYVNI